MGGHVPPGTGKLIAEAVETARIGVETYEGALRIAAPSLAPEAVIRIARAAAAAAHEAAMQVMTSSVREHQGGAR